MEYVIEVKGVSKRFKDKTAVNRVSFSIEPGTVIAILGPNGAGKTTMISMMLGLLEPSEGEIRLFGRSPKDIMARNRLGAMLQEVGVIDRITVGEMIDLFRSYYKNPLPRKMLLQYAGLEKEEQGMAEKLSGGQQRRLGFALALAGNPDLLFLDEPTVGMDVTSRRLFWNSIRELAREGRTIIVTTHYLEEADGLADRIILFKDGMVAADGTPAHMKGTITKRFVTCCVDHKVTDDMLRELPYVISVTRSGNRVSLETENTDAVIRAIVESGLEVYDIGVERGSLEDVFEKLVEEEAR